MTGIHLMVFCYLSALIPLVLLCAPYLMRQRKDGDRC